MIYDFLKANMNDITDIMNDINDIVNDIDDIMNDKKGSQYCERQNRLAALLISHRLTCWAFIIMRVFNVFVHGLFYFFSGNKNAIYINKWPPVI